MADTAPEGEAPELRTISRAEVVEHTSKDDCWVIIHGLVVNATSFLDDHPGGGDIILEHAGTWRGCRTRERGSVGAARDTDNLGPTVFTLCRHGRYPSVR
jgi:hypothetical protein